MIIPLPISEHERRLNELINLWFEGINCRKNPEESDDVDRRFKIHCETYFPYNDHDQIWDSMMERYNEERFDGWGDPDDVVARELNSLEPE